MGGQQTKEQPQPQGRLIGSFMYDPYDNSPFNGLSLHHIDYSLTPCEEPSIIIGETLSKFDDDLIHCIDFGDGITSYVPEIEKAMRVVEGSGGQYHVPLIVGDGQAEHCNCHLCRFLPSAGGNDGGPNGGNQFKWVKDPHGENTGRLNGGVDTSQGDKPWNRWLHSQFVGYGFSHITSLKGHQKVISAIALPSGSDKLYSGSKDESQGVELPNRAVSMGGEVGCMISEGPWLFSGIPDSIKVWNTQTGAEMSLSCPTGQVYALVAANDMLFAGTEDGRILVWRYSAQTNCFEPAASLMGHRLAVIALVVGGTKLYSGSMDHTIKAWDLTTLWCVQTLPDHTNVVTSLLCWEQFLISCSLDNTVKFWSTNNKEQLEVTYTHNEEHGVLTLCGMHDLQGKPVLLCSLNDNSVRLCDLPSFNERGRIFAKKEVQTMQTGPCGIFFTGDRTGEMKVWQWLT